MDKEETQQIDQGTRKLTTMNKALHLRDDLSRLYVSRKEGRGLISIEDCEDKSTQELVDYIKKSKERLITEANRYKKRKKNNNMKQKWEEKQMCEDFKRQTGEITHEISGHGYERETLKLKISLF